MDKLQGTSNTLLGSADALFFAPRNGSTILAASLKLRLSDVAVHVHFFILMLLIYSVWLAINQLFSWTSMHVVSKTFDTSRSP
jgi:hypothetical protein